ncbi:MAG: lasso peptide biosynthesis B2 protein [Gemmatimonadales bacterium]
MRRDSGRLGAISKAILGARICYWYAAVRIGLWRWPLPHLVERLSRPPKREASSAPQHLEPRRLGRIVHRVLGLGPIRARCLYSSLVFYRLLREQGAEPELVIGLPAQATSPEAHAWVELDGAVVGPPPGRLGRQRLARYGVAGPRPGMERADRGEAEAKPQTESNAESSRTGSRSPQSNAE